MKWLILQFQLKKIDGYLPNVRIVEIFIIGIIEFTIGIIDQINPIRAYIVKQTFLRIVTLKIIFYFTSAFKWWPSFFFVQTFLYGRISLPNFSLLMIPCFSSTIVYNMVYWMEKHKLFICWLRNFWLSANLCFLSYHYR